MPENMMNSAQKANSKEFNSNYDRIFTGREFDVLEDCPKVGCYQCAFKRECDKYFLDKHDIDMGEW